jgi:hypothetical protein
MALIDPKFTSNPPVACAPWVYSYRWLAITARGSTAVNLSAALDDEDDSDESGDEWED